MVARYAQLAQAPADPEAVEPALMTVAQAAAALGWSEKQVRSALERTFLAGFKPGGLRSSRWAVYRWSVEERGSGRRGVDPGALAGQLRELARLHAEAAALELKIEDALRDSTIMREPRA